MEVSPLSLWYTHLGLLGLLVLLAYLRPPRALHLSLLAAAFAATLILPVTWVGPAWEDPGDPTFAWGFFLSFASSLGIPFACGSSAVAVLDRRPATPRPIARVGWPTGAYVAGLLLSLPVSFNYALAYPFLR